MGLEAATFINELNAANPVGASDPKGQGDDHIRMIKAALQATFPAFTSAAVTLTQAQINDAARKTASNVFTVAQTIQGQLTLGPGAVSAYMRSVAPAGVNIATYQEWYRTNGSTRRGYIGYPTNADNTLAIVNEEAGAAIALTSASITLNTVNITDYARRSQANIFTGAASQITLSSTIAQLALNETDAAANNRRWDITADGEQLMLRTVDDAVSSATALMTVDRTLNVIDAIAWNATAMSFNGVLSLTKAAVVPAGYPFIVNSADPFIAINESDGAANNRLWDIGAGGEDLLFRALTDAGVATTWMQVTRTAGAVDSINKTAGVSMQFSTPLLAVPGIHNGTAPTGTAERIASGTYNPGFTNVANLGSISAAAPCQWIRVGNVVTVSGVLSIDPTAGSVVTTARMTIPIASNFTAVGQLGGAGSAQENSVGVGFSAVIATDDALVSMFSGSPAVHTVPFSFTYLVV